MKLNEIENALEKELNGCCDKVWYNIQHNGDIQLRTICCDCLICESKDINKIIAVINVMKGCDKDET